MSHIICRAIAALPFDTRVTRNVVGRVVRTFAGSECGERAREAVENAQFARECANRAV